MSERPAAEDGTRAWQVGLFGDDGRCFGLLARRYCVRWMAKRRCRIESDADTRLRQRHLGTWMVVPALPADGPRASAGAS